MRSQDNNQPVPAIGVGGLLFNKHGQVLLIRRNQAPASGKWSIPGGRQEAGENLVDACRREFAEETCLSVEVGQVIALVERRIEGFHYVIIDFLVNLTDEDRDVPMARSDVAEAKWFNLDQIDRLDLVPGLAEIIVRCNALLGNNKHAGLFDHQGNGNDFIL